MEARNFLNMKKSKLKWDTLIGHALQKKADDKRDRIEIAAYLALNLEGLTKEQRRLKLLELAEKNGKD